MRRVKMLWFAETTSLSTFPLLLLSASFHNSVIVHDFSFGLFGGYYWIGIRSHIYGV